MKPIDPQVLVKAINNLLHLPFPTICRHSVALDLLQILEAHGADLSQFSTLVQAVVKADDETALSCLPALQTYIGARGEKRG